jgi:hypothetical protein
MPLPFQLKAAASVSSMACQQRWIRELEMTENEYLNGAVRTYTVAPGGISVLCRGVEARDLALHAQQTQRSLLHIPGERRLDIPDEVMSLYNTIEELRGLPNWSLPDAEARQDLLEHELEQQQHHCYTKLGRRVLYGTYQWRRPLEQCIPFGGDGPIEPSWLAIVIVPPKIRSCTIIFDPCQQ